MAKLSVGDIMPDFQYTTPYQKGLYLAETVKNTHKTAILFLRYYGCPICQLDLHELTKYYDKITSRGGQVLVVLQSEPVSLKEKIGENVFPFSIICDPDQKLYQRFEIESAHSMAKMADTKTMLKVAKAKAAGYNHGDYEGNELQLPATFVIDQNSVLTYVHYGKSAADIPNADILQKILD